MPEEKPVKYGFHAATLHKKLMEKALNLRASAYLSSIKSQLLIETILKIETSKKKFKREIDELLRLQDVLRRQSQIFDNITRIVITGIGGAIVDCNAAAEHLFGYSKALLLGKTAAVFHRPSDTVSFVDYARSRINGRGKWTGMLDFIRSDGSDGVCQLVIAPLNFYTPETSRCSPSGFIPVLPR